VENESEAAQASTGEFTGVPGFDIGAVKYRDQRKRYPWWVKTVDEITTETDDSRLEKPKFHAIAHGALFEPERLEENAEKSKEFVATGIKEDIAGRSLPDLALHYAANTYMHFTVGSLGDPYFNVAPGIGEIGSSWKLHPPQSLGLPPWKASPERASDVVEAAGNQLGAAMVGITTIDPRWLNANVSISSEVDQVTNDGMKTIIPERMKYVICLMGVCPPNLVDRNLTELGAAGDRAGYEAAFMAYVRMLRFVKGLGYDAFDLMPVAPVIPFAIASGLGELGRMNRLVNPIFGGNVRLGAVLTDLPLAVDKPIDFGLQKFCSECKKCARSCPSNAISKADQPYWETFNQWQASGKKAYFEDNEACFTFQSSKDIYCSTCMAVCPWSKQDRTLLHEMAHIMAAKLPSKLPGMGKLLVKLDDLFGYGRIRDGDTIRRWWQLKNPTRGVSSHQGRRRSKLRQFIR
jgi:reductive dehalogenase